jgi:hypothetical protein
MIDDSKPDNGPAIRAVALARIADSQRTSAAYRQGLHVDGNKWRVGSLSLWRSEAFKTACLSNDPFPYYDRGGIRESVYPDMRFEAEPFRTIDGRPAIAIVLRSDKDPEGVFGTFSLDQNDAHRIIELLNREMDATRAMAMARFRANGGDPASVASRRAPSRAERWAILDALLGDPDDDGDKGR